MSVSESISDDAISAAVQTGHERTVEFLQEIIRCPSVNPWFEAPVELYCEERVQDIFQARLEALGATDIDRWEPDPRALAHHAEGPGYVADRDFSGRPNLVARLRGTDQSAPTLLLLGHCDVVAPAAAWTTDPFGAERRDGRIYGRGAVDMKGGMAAAIGALEALRDAGVRLPGDVLVASVVDEEAGGMGTLAFVDRGYRADGAIIPEPTGLNIAPLCRGILWGEVELFGRNGHIELLQPDWREGGAVDAIAYGRELLNAIEDLNSRWSERPDKNHPLLLVPCQVKVAQLDAGRFPTTYADSCRITFNAQYLPSDKDEHGLGSRIKRELETFFSEFRGGDDDWLEAHPPGVRWLVDAGCGETSVDARVVQVVRGAARTAGADCTLQGSSFHTDMGLIVDSGIPAINFGPGDVSVSHQPDEHIAEDDLRTATLTMALAIRQFCE